MKKMKKIVSLMLMLVMVVAMAVTASADSYTITISNSTTGHTYEAYQIFSGDLSGSSPSYVLSNIKWGSGITSGDNLLSALTELTVDGSKPFSTCTSAQDVADVLTKCSDDDAVAKAFASTVSDYLGTAIKTSSYETDHYEISVSSPGYYLVKDQDDSLTGSDDAYTRLILEVVGDVTVKPKSSTPTVEKKVQDINDSEDADVTDNDWQDSADYDIGDSIPYKLTATLPNTLGDYSSYKLEFTDTMSKGLKYNNDAVVTVYSSKSDAASGSNGVVVTNDCSINSSAYTGTDPDDVYVGGTVLTVSITNVKSLTGVTVSKDSVIVVTYSATLNSDAVIGDAGNPNKVDLTYSNNPNKTTDTGKTPEDVNKVFTFEVDANKIDKDNNALAGAMFTLYKYSKSTETYVKVTDKIKYYAVVDTVLTEVASDDEGKTWRLASAAAGATDDKYIPTTFKFVGLDDGLYKLVESTTPSGYNTIEDVIFTVSATHSEIADNPALTALTTDVTSGTATLTPTTSTGIISTDIVNKSGTTMPSTGGIGTTLFYVIGTILVLLAAVLLVTRKRMSSEK